MTIIPQSYDTIKREAGAEFVRKVILETKQFFKGNIKATAKALHCDRKTVYFALEKEKKGDLSDLSHSSLSDT